MTITICHTEAGDAEAIQRIYASESAYAGTLRLPYPPLALWQQRLASMPAGMHNLVALLDGEVVGQGALITNPDKPRRRHAAGLGMGVREDRQQRGVGDALLGALLGLADDWPQILRVELEVYCDNESALALYRKHGFVEEGRLRGYAFRAGRYVDSYTMARLRPGFPPAGAPQ
jgi:putative acetyltransferase